MPEQFLHGVEVIEIDAGPRPIRTVRSGVIGIVGTAPDAEGATAAELVTGSVALNTAILWTATQTGPAGNNVRVTLVDPDDVSQALSVSASGNDITVSLATDVSGDITSTAQDIVTAVGSAGSAVTDLVGAANQGDSDGTGVVMAAGFVALSGGADEPFPLNTPVLVAGSRAEAAKLGDAGSLPGYMDGIFDQVGAVCVVVRVAEGVDETATIANIVGGVDAGTGDFEGVHAFLGAESVVGFSPRILIAPGFTHQKNAGERNAVVAELVGIAERLRAIIVQDGPNTTDQAAIQAAGDFGSARVYLVDPWVTTLQSDGSVKSEAPSARVAGIIAKIDNERGFWWSPSNQEINGIVGTTRAVDFKLGDTSSRANLLNENNVTTIIREGGFRLWGNRTLSTDPKFAFLSVRRTADIINDSLQRAHLWAVDRNITKTYVDDVVEGVNAYLRSLVALEAILGGKCWADPDLNTPANITQGKVYFNFDFTPPYPAEHITFRSHLVNDYISEVFA